jgi:hypothetical protein
MEINKLRKEITQLIDNVKEHSDYLTDFDRIPHVELEMILVKIKKLHERAIIFNHEYEREMLSRKTKSEPVALPADNQTINEVKAVMPEQKEIEKVQDAAPDMPKENFPEDVPEKKTMIAAEEKLVEDLPETKLVKEQPGTHTEEISGGRTEGTKADLNEKLKAGVKAGSLNETIGSGKLYASLSNKLQMNPIGDLSKAIGINEKFSFTKELFKNDSAAFSEAITKLNNFSNFAEAEHYFQDELSKKYQWKDDSEQAMKLLELVQRRYL